MPLVRIDLIQGWSSDYRKTIGGVVYEAMIENFKVPKNDHFQVITEHPAEGFIFDPSYLGIQRSRDCVFIQLTFNEGRTVEQKQRFYKAVADGLYQRLSLRREVSRRALQRTKWHGRCLVCNTLKGLQKDPLS